MLNCQNNHYIYRHHQPFFLITNEKALQSLEGGNLAWLIMLLTLCNVLTARLVQGQGAPGQSGRRPAIAG